MNKINKLYFLGAGSTVSLGLPTTEQQGKLISEIVFSNNSNDLFSTFVKHYFNSSNLDINLLYNILDSHIIENRTLYIENNVFGYKELSECKNVLSYTIYQSFNDIIRNNINNIEKRQFKDEKVTNAYKALYDFYIKLAEKNLNKKVNEYTKEVAKKREFIFTDYAIINTNWDLYSILPMFLAHQELNNRNDYYLSKSNNNAKLKIFNDLGMPFACNPREDKDIWYPYNESVATRINDPDYNCSRVVTLVRTYYPHGLMNFYQCKCCHKHVLNIGDLKYEDIVKERDLLRNNEVIKCPFCGKSIKEFDLDVLLQSNFKIISNYLKELRYDMINALESANELIFIGYSLPSDDVDYMTLFKNIIANNPNLKVKVVLYDSSITENEFIDYKDQKIGLISISNKEVVNRYLKVFGENVYFNFVGAPKCFDNEDIY